ncbi:unnamed protein product [Rangifer tarandus platyrhynchus]|uniref:ATP-binding cassette, sub-family C (CFTR/MRP), member 4 n=1 Tax=Rangifer tarandus platyrhynchus TaxID=3082113 RepID=A0ABN9A212_RANTA|nr:unnamed protein product [Rangifer tarandus platyrhynchus]
MRKPNPLQDANFCSRLFFWWLNPLFKIGHKRRLEEDDMYAVLPEDHSQHLGEELQVVLLYFVSHHRYWDQEVLRAEKDAREPSLTKGIIKCHWKSYLVLGIFILLEEGTRVVQPLFLGKMINYVENSNRTDIAALREAYGYAAGLSTSVLVWAVLHHLYFYHIQRVGMRLRVAVCHMIYCKALGTPTLQGLSFTVRPGELLAVIGPVGAGKDLQLLKDGDLTVIGDRGTPLSEGQKACVNLARAVYQDADIYLLDDPLSAVDTGVSRHLFEQCIHQALKEKITILVTHQWQFLKDASQILILKNGKIIQKGTLVEFPKFGVDFEDILLKKKNEEGEPSPGPGAPSLNSESSVQFQQSPRPSLKDAAPEDQDAENIQVTLPLEGRLVGKVGFKTYMNYFTAGAHWFIIIFLILVNVTDQVAYVLQDWWLADWANGQSSLYAITYGKGKVIVLLDPVWYLTVYSVLTAGTVLLSITRSLLIFYVLVNSSQIFHNKMLESILRVPVLFFDRNPVGRILNRFSKDIGHLDDLLPLTFLDFIHVM